MKNHSIIGFFIHYLKDAHPDSNELSISISLPPDSKGFRTDDDDDDKEVHVEVTILKEDEAGVVQEVEQKQVQPNPDEQEDDGEEKEINAVGKVVAFEKDNVKVNPPHSYNSI